MKQRVGWLFILFVSGTLYAQQTYTISVKKYESDCFFNSVKLDISGPTPPYTIKWNTGANGDSVSNLNGGDFTVQISSHDSIAKDTSISFALRKPPCGVSFQNHFTPNGDGFNDTWGISNTEYYPGFLLEVFDRSGQLVHVQRKEYIPWEGNQFGIKLSDATYFFIFYYDEKVKSRHEKGTVTIVR